MACIVGFTSLAVAYDKPAASAEAAAADRADSRLTALPAGNGQIALFGSFGTGDAA